MSTSIVRIQKVPKSFPFAKRGKQMIPKAFDLGYHVTVLGKYSKKIPKREPSALDLRHSQSTVKWMNDTRKFDPRYYREH
jgi:hypothetical protein